jgi:hypothetical protein
LVRLYAEVPNPQNSAHADLASSAINTRQNEATNEPENHQRRRQRGQKFHGEGASGDRFCALPNSQAAKSNDHKPSVIQPGSKVEGRVLTQPRSLADVPGINPSSSASAVGVLRRQLLCFEHEVGSFSVNSHAAEDCS